MTARLEKFGLPLLLVTTALCAAGCTGQAGRDSSAQAAHNSATCADKPLATFRAELLALAFRTATAIPTDPHIKDRCRAQEGVVVTCLELDQGQRARGYIGRIDNWRRGAAYADLASYFALRGCDAQARQCVHAATEVCKITEDWRRDRIRIKIAQAHLLLGDEAEASRFEKSVDVENEQGKLAAARIMKCNEKDFDACLRAMDELLAVGSFDVTTNTLTSYTELFSRVYSDEARRTTIEERIKASSAKLPLEVRLNLLLKLAEHALAHDDRVKALALVNEAQAAADGSSWPLRYGIPMMGRLAAMRGRAGETAQARTEADAALAIFDERREQIVSIDRAGILRPIAEAYQALGNTERALAVYGRAVEEGTENPNSRPRAEDLCATCCSMALNGVEPDAALWRRIRQISEGLGQPW
ncbi:MAG: hypothetical protein JXL80_17815 [Planctomycetes bacterium]|nr:hypothetical protein [Planctomycetota bacterium]